MLIKTTSLPMNGGNSFPWGATIILTVTAIGIGYMAYKVIDYKNLKTVNNEGSDRIA
jgi:hypothetical protein